MDIRSAVSSLRSFAKAFRNTSGYTVLGLLATLQVSDCFADRLPMSAAAQGVTDYVSARRAYAATLARAIGLKQTDSYRLVAVTGPEWQVGDMIDIDDPSNVLSYACRFRRKDLPPSTSWSSFPELSQLKKSIGLNLGLPRGLSQILDKLGISAGVGISSNITGKYSLSNLQGPIVAKDDFEHAIGRGACLKARKRPALIIRGVISGIESLASEDGFSSQADIKVLQTDVAVVRYDKANNFVMSDITSRPKFYLITLDALNSRGSSTKAGLEPPPLDVVSRLEKSNITTAE